MRTATASAWAAVSMTAPSPSGGGASTGPALAFWAWPIIVRKSRNCLPPAGISHWTASSAISRSFCCVRFHPGRDSGAIEVALGVSRGHHPQGKHQHENPYQIRLTAHYLPSNTGQLPCLVHQSVRHTGAQTHSETIHSDVSSDTDIHYTEQPVNQHLPGTSSPVPHRHASPCIGQTSTADQVLAQIELVRRVVSLVPITITDGIQRCRHLRPLSLGYLQADHHPPVVGTVVAVVEHGDVPAPAQLVEEVE